MQRDAQAIDLRAATCGDAGAFARLHRPLFDPPWCADDFSRLLAAATTVSLIATLSTDEQRILAGFVVAQVVVDEAEILTIAVDEAYQHRGVGSRLLSALAHDLGGRGVVRVHLDVATGNRAARALYTRAGFFAIGERRGYYASTAAGTAIMMVRTLGQHEG